MQVGWELMTTLFIAGMQGRAVEDWVVMYPDALVGRAGDRLTLGCVDEEWPFIWCVAADGKAGWVPLGFVEQQGDVGVLRRDYTAQELALTIGEVVTLHDEESGWYWATNQLGLSGWVPMRAVVIVGCAGV